MPIIDYAHKCIDPLGKIFLQVALEYAVESAKLRGAEGLLSDMRKEIEQMQPCEEPIMNYSFSSPKKKTKTEAREEIDIVTTSSGERRQPELWGKAIFEGKGTEKRFSGEYDSPHELASALGIETHGARNMVAAFRRAGFDVRGNGDEVEKGKTKFIVSRVTQTPSRFRRTPEDWTVEEGLPGHTGVRKSAPTGASDIERPSGGGMV
jgi:hypothetical protein